VGSTETSLCRIAGAQLARFYKVPSHTTAPNSDNHAHDEQNAWEKTFSTFCAVGAANDLLVNCGMFATGMTCSHEQLLMDEEISACALRLAAGLEVSPETVAAGLIRERGPQGETYLTAEHTLRRLRSGEYLKPRLSVSGPFATWQEQGARDTYQLARERGGEGAGGAGGSAGAQAAGSVPPLEAGRRKALDEIIAGFRL
jgi:trimethylamine--corrinoid protein Co-methyltransferase